MRNNNNRKRKIRKHLNVKGWLVCILLGLFFIAGCFYIGNTIFHLFKESNEKVSTTTVKNEAETKSTQVTKKETSKPTAITENKYDKLYGDSKYLIHIHKLSYKLELFEKGKVEPIKTYGVAVARNVGDKKMPGDNRTPISWGNAVNIHYKYKGAKIGVSSQEVPFRVEDICDAHSWTHDFGDGKGVIANAYGPWFISLDTGWQGIGIHGTHAPESIGTKASEGCIRLKNPEIEELKKIISSYKGGIGTGVIITED